MASPIPPHLRPDLTGLDPRIDAEVVQHAQNVARWLYHAFAVTINQAADNQALWKHWAEDFLVPAMVHVHRIYRRIIPGLFSQDEVLDAVRYVAFHASRIWVVTLRMRTRTHVSFANLVAFSTEWTRLAFRLFKASFILAHCHHAALDWTVGSNWLRLPHVLPIEGRLPSQTLQTVYLVLMREVHERLGWDIANQTVIELRVAQGPRPRATLQQALDHDNAEWRQSVWSPSADRTSCLSRERRRRERRSNADRWGCYASARTTQPVDPVPHVRYAASSAASRATIPPTGDQPAQFLTGRAFPRRQPVYRHPHRVQQPAAPQQQPVHAQQPPQLHARLQQLQLHAPPHQFIHPQQPPHPHAQPRPHAPFHRHIPPRPLQYPPQYPHAQAPPQPQPQQGPLQLHQPRPNPLDALGFHLNTPSSGSSGDSSRWSSPPPSTGSSDLRSSSSGSNSFTLSSTSYDSSGYPRHVTIDEEDEGTEMTSDLSSYDSSGYPRRAAPSQSSSSDLSGTSYDTSGYTRRATSSRGSSSSGSRSSGSRSSHPSSGYPSHQVTFGFAPHPAPMPPRAGGRAPLVPVQATIDDEEDEGDSPMTMDDPALWGPAGRYYLGPGSP